MTDTTTTAPASEAKELTDAQKEQADTLIEQLKKEAEHEAWKYMSSHVPAEYQEYFLSSNPEPEDPNAPAKTQAPQAA